jgi:hypothetical protein
MQAEVLLFFILFLHVSFNKNVFHTNKTRVTSVLASLKMQMKPFKSRYFSLICIGSKP